MAEKCMNPFCNKPFRLLGHGKMFVVEFPRTIAEQHHDVGGRREHFWLCEQCARLMTLAVRREYGSVSVRIINLAPNGATKFAFAPPMAANIPNRAEPAFAHSGF